MPVTITNEQQNVINFLRGRSVGVLATSSPTGEPHAAVVYFSFNEHTVRFYFITKRDTEKNHNLAQNDRAALAIYDAKQQATVQVKGQVVEVKDTQRIESIFRDIMQAAVHTSNSNVPPITRLQAGPYEVYQLNPISFRMATYIQPDPGGYEKLFEVF